MVLNVTLTLLWYRRQNTPNQRRPQHKTHMKELEAATAILKNGTISAGSCSLPEMVKASACRMDFLTLLLDLVHTVWEEQRVA